MLRAVTAAAALSLITSCVSSPPVPCTDCSGKCVDLETDSRNCGKCGTTCTAGSACTNGSCVPSCPAGSTLCGPICADTANDPGNCGTCGHACAAGEFCRGSACTPDCPLPLNVCGAACVDAQTDPKNCGMCGKTCTPGERCSSGACTAICGTGLSLCSVTDGGAPQCTDLENDVSNCGGCNLACALGGSAATVSCQKSACVSTCLPGWEDKDGQSGNGCEQVTRDGLLLWLKPETLALAADAGVTAWPDSSGNALPVLTAPEAAGAPRYLPNARNGNAAVTFDGVGEALSTPNLALHDTARSEVTVLAAFKPATDAQRFLLMHRGINCTSNFELGTHTGVGTRANLGLHTGCGNASVSTIDVGSEWQVATVATRGYGNSPNNVELYRNGLSLAVTQDMGGYADPGAYNVLQRPLFIGARQALTGAALDNYFKGEVGELMVFKRSLSIDERQSLERYLMAKWGIARPKVYSGNIELLDTSAPLVLQASSADGGVMQVATASSGGFTFPTEPGAPGLTVISGPTATNCWVLDAGSATPAGDLERALVTCGFGRQVTRAAAASETMTTSPQFTEVVPWAPLEFTTVRPGLHVLVNVFVPYLAGQLAPQSVFGEAVLGISVDGVVVAQTTNQSAYWGMGGPTSVSGVTVVGPGRHVVRAVWRVGNALGANAPAMPSIRMADGAWSGTQDGLLSAVVLESYASFRGLSTSESSAVLSSTSVALAPLLPAATMTLSAPSKVLTGLWVPDGYNAVATSQTNYELQWNATKKGTASFFHETAKKPASVWHLETADAGVHSFGAAYAPSTSRAGGSVVGESFVGTSGQARRIAALAFDAALPSVSLSRSTAVSAPMGVATQLFTGNLVLTKRTQVLAVLTVDGMNTVGNGLIGDVLMNIASVSTGGPVQSQNSFFSQPVTVVWVGTLAAGTHALGAAVFGRSGAVETTAGISSMHVLGLE